MGAMPGTTTWREIRAELVKPEDEPRIAAERQKIKVLLREYAERDRRTATGRP
jgi:hypothetical protein